MKSREELKKQHEELLEVHKKVADQLSKYPNVVKVGVGVKQTGGKLTEEPCLKIVVKEKIKEADLDSDDIIPAEIEGFKTDVIVQTDRSPLAVCAEDQNNYRPVKGGIMINNSRNGSGTGGSGTLGCLAQLDSDDSWVLLSNHHVLYGEKGQDDDDIGQPWVGCSWCCKTNVIGKNVDKDETLDCAIAAVNDDIAIQNVIEEIGDIGGNATAPAVSGEKVRKKGARTGYTSGTVDFIDPGTQEITIEPNPAGGPADDPGGCTNYESGKTIFAYFGDSGSVIVNDDNEVIALLYAIDSATHTKGFANDIGRIESELSITINATSSEPGVTPVLREEIAHATIEANAVSNETLIKYFETRLEESETGRKVKEVIKRHQKEVLHLVNNHRPVTVTWQRKQGPAYVAAFVRSIKKPDYAIPEEINRVSLQNLLMSMATVLEEHGSEELKRDIESYGLDVIMWSRKCNSAAELIEIISTLDDKVPAESVRRPMTK